MSAAQAQKGHDSIHSHLSEGWPSVWKQEENRNPKWLNEMERMVSTLLAHKYVMVKAKLHKLKARSHKSQMVTRVQIFATPWTVAHQAPLFMGFSRQEYCWHKRDWTASPHILRFEVLAGLVSVSTSGWPSWVSLLTFLLPQLAWLYFTKEP